MTISTFRIFLKKKSVFGRIGKFLVLKSCIRDVSSDFGSDAFSPMLVDICWIYTKGHPGIFFLISLGSLVLFKDSKTMVRFYGHQKEMINGLTGGICRMEVDFPIINIKG